MDSIRIAGFSKLTCWLKVTMLPLSLEEATIRMMKPDSIAREESVFGNDFVDHYGGTREHEVKLWNAAVTSWEGESILASAKT